MNGNPGPSDRRRYVGQNELFERKSTKDLVKLVPECEGFRMIENLNEVFEILEEKTRMMSRVMVNLLGEDFIATSFTKHEILKRLVEDCQMIGSLMDVQKLKLGVMKNEIPMTTASREHSRENEIIKRLISRKRKLPPNPYTNVEPSRKKKRDLMIGNVFRSVYRDFLLFPAPIFKVSEFSASMKPSKSQKFHDSQTVYVIQELVRRKIIYGFTLPSGDDAYILKELNISCIGKHLRSFDVSDVEYLQASVPKKLSDLNEIISKMGKSILEEIDSKIWTILSYIIMATVIKDQNKLVAHDEFPEHLPKSVMNASTTLSRLGFLDLCVTSGEATMKFEKNVNTVTFERLGKIFGNPKITLKNE